MIDVSLLNLKPVVVTSVKAFEYQMRIRCVVTGTLLT